MKKRFSIFVLLISIFLPILINAQVLTTEPLLPIASQPVTIFFHSDKETGNLKDYTGTLYAHTGVILSDASTWQNVKGTWGNNSTQPQFEYLGNKTYKLIISPSIVGFYGTSLSKTIKKIAIVIRSADGSKQTSPDIFINVYEEGLNVSFSVPAERSKIVDLSGTVPVIVNASLSDSIALYRNGSFITGIGSAQTLSYSFTADVEGEYQVIAKAFAAGQTVSDTFFYFVRPEPTVAALPGGIKDGINYISESSVILSLYAPLKSYAFVLGDFSNWTANSSTYMNRTPDGTHYWVQLDGLIPGKEYAYQYFVDGNLLIGDPYADKVLDPWNDEWISSSTYPNLKPYPKNLTTGIVSVFQTAQAVHTWNHSNYTPPVKENAMIYELLLRDFLAAHDWKTLTDTLNYFSKLGVTALEIMPFNEFEGNESWGYNPSYYFAPDKYYGPKDDLKAFVDSCHGRGIAVIMDMVLNHSYGQSPLAQLYWNSALSRPSADNPWYNVTSPNPSYSWGNDFNHESQATKDFVDRVTSYWMTEYKVDGYRFDFTKGFTNTPGDGGAYDAARIAILKRMADKIWEVNPNAYVILEHFTDNSEEKELANYGMMIWGNMNGSYNEASMGWNESGKSDLSWVSYKNRGWSEANLVGYMESHDEERVVYKTLTYGNSSGTYNTKQLPVALRRSELAAAFFLTIPGPKMIWQFGEMGYDISIDQGGRVSSKPLHWEYLNTRQRMNPVYSALIHLKTDEPAFSTANFTLSVAGAVKRIELNHTDMDVRIIGNFDVVSQEANPNFSVTGNWYDYFSGETLNVTNVTTPISLQPGEYRIYTTKALTKPDLPTSIKNETLIGEGFSVFPNPVEGQLFVEGRNTIDLIRITDIGGRTVKILRPASDVAIIDFSGMAPGVYLLVADQKNLRTVQKVVKR